MAAIGQPTTVAKSRRPFGVRLYLTLGFAAVASIAAGFSYLLVTGSSDEAAGEEASNVTIGRTARVADRIGAHPWASAATQIQSVNDPGFSAWAFDRHGRLLTPIGERQLRRPCAGRGQSRSFQMSSPSSRCRSFETGASQVPCWRGQTGRRRSIEPSTRFAVIA